GLVGDERQSEEGGRRQQADGEDLLPLATGRRLRIGTPARERRRRLGGADPSIRRGLLRSGGEAARSSALHPVLLVALVSRPEGQDRRGRGKINLSASGRVWTRPHPPRVLSDFSRSRSANSSTRPSAAVARSPARSAARAGWPPG